MRYKYTLYPDAREKLDSAGITARVIGAKERYEIGNTGCIMQSDIPEMVNDMKARGYFTTFPQDKLADFKAKANSLFATPEKRKWLVHKHDKVHEEGIENEDILSLVGYDASLILKPDEIWNFEKFGFKNMTDFTGSITALMSDVIHSSPFRRGYIWQAETPDKRTLVNEVTGDGNCDMRVFQRDMTPYKTIDPFENEVSFRPELRSDVGGIMAYHSTEGELLSIVLKYVEQRGLKPETLRDNAREVLTWAESLGQGGGTCSEHFGGHDVNALMFFTGWDIPFAKLDKDNTTRGRSVDGIVTESHGAYFAFLDNDNNLVFAYLSKEAPSVPQKEVCAVYSPEDVDHLIKGLLYQSAKGLGRTSCRQLRGILECRFSEEFQKEVVNHERDTWKVVKM